MFCSGIIGRHKAEVPTPALLLDLDAVDRNVAKLSKFFSSLDCRLRPHAKTHKLPLIAHKQVRAGAIGITCAKLQDAKAFVDAGIENVLIANQVAAEKIPELVGLSQVANVIVCVDNLENASELSTTARRVGVTVDVLIEVDVGLGRCGVPPGEDTITFLRKLLDIKNIRYRGIMGYEGGIFVEDEAKKLSLCQECNQRLLRTKEAIERAGLPVEIVTAGGSNTYNITGLCPGITDIQPGSYVTMDGWNRKHGQDFEQAISVLATVISRPTQERAVTDAGVKAISADLGLPEVVSPASAKIETFTDEEHARLVLSGEASSLRVGDKVELVPMHGCTTVPLYPAYVALKNNVVVDVLEIVSRGATY